MIELTKERLEQYIKNPLEHGLTRSEQMEMARQLLAGMEHEPVAWISDSGKSLVLDSEIEPCFKFNGWNPLGCQSSAAPQSPQPAVVPPEYATPARADNEWQNGYCIGWNACRAAMLQGASTPFVPVK